ncbi:hypothetical protein [Nocardia sp. NPDC051570]|uniref:hypothetical protein n=1 Tax=Nocardia sp. NPDC051570 TaxID=3364324 RepID=UPI0037888D06
MGYTAEQQQGAWIEAIAMVEALRAGNKPLARQVLTTSPHPAPVLDGLLRLTSVLLHSIPPNQIDSLLTIAYRSDPPPPIPHQP